MKPHLLCTSLAALSVQMAMLASANAQTPTKPKTVAVKPAPAVVNQGESLLTRDQLRDCLRLQDRNKLEGEAVVQEQAALEVLKSGIASDNALLEQRRSAVEAADVQGQMSLQQQSSRLDAKIDDYNARLPTFNNRVQQLQASRTVWSSQCADKPFEESDLWAIKRGK
jgi:hypothetical protein